MKRLTSITVGAFLAIAMVLGSGVSLAAGAPYDSAYGYSATVPSSTGGDPPTASYSNDASTGALSFSVAAATDDPVGVAIPYSSQWVGAEYAIASGSVGKTINGVGAGVKTATTTINLTSLSGPTATWDPARFPYLYGTDSNALASAAITLYVTFYQTNDCVYGTCSYTGVYETLDLTGQSTGTKTLTKSITVPAGQSGYIMVTVAMGGYAQAGGNDASASASASSTVTDITLS